MCQDQLDYAVMTNPRPQWLKVARIYLHFQCVKVKVKSLSHVRLVATPWTAAYQAPPSMGFSYST